MRSWGHTTRVIFTVKICIFKRSNEKKIISRKLKYIFATIIRIYWAKKYQRRSEIEFWATCHNISNLCDGCWYPLLIQEKDFYRRYTPNCTGEVFAVHKIQYDPITYKRKDLNGVEINESFYEPELLKAKQDVFGINKVFWRDYKTNELCWSGKDIVMILVVGYQWWMKMMVN